MTITVTGKGSYPMTCPKCDGAGYEARDGLATCPWCHGVGSYSPSTGVLVAQFVTIVLLVGLLATAFTVVLTS